MRNFHLQTLRTLNFNTQSQFNNYYDHFHGKHLDFKIKMMRDKNWYSRIRNSRSAKLKKNQFDLSKVIRHSYLYSEEISNSSIGST